jgi:hypothetical protein
MRHLSALARVTRLAQWLDVLDQITSALTQRNNVIARDVLRRTAVSTLAVMLCEFTQPFLFRMLTMYGGDEALTSLSFIGMLASLFSVIFLPTLQQFTLALRVISSPLTTVLLLFCFIPWSSRLTHDSLVFLVVSVLLSPDRPPAFRALRRVTIRGCDALVKALDWQRAFAFRTNLLRNNDRGRKPGGMYGSKFVAILSLCIPILLMRLLCILKRALFVPEFVLAVSPLPLLGRKVGFTRLSYSRLAWLANISITTEPSVILYEHYKRKFLLAFDAYLAFYHSTSSCFASLRIAISRTAAWDVPNLVASTFIRRLASGLRRMLVASFFMSQLYHKMRYISSARFGYAVY